MSSRTATLCISVLTYNYTCQLQYGIWQQKSPGFGRGFFAAVIIGNNELFKSVLRWQPEDPLDL